MVAFNNTFSPAALANQNYLNSIAAAEQFIASNWTNPITINIKWDLQFNGTNAFLASNSWPQFVNVSYTALRNALIAHANNPDAQAAVATLPINDPTGGHIWSLPEAYARMLGLSSQVFTPDDTIILNASYNWAYNGDVADALIHEITEGAMGRVGGLGDQNSVWSTMDLFRYSSAGVRDFTDGRDGLTTYFSVDGHTLLLPYNNQYNGAIHQNTNDTADFTVLDIFGIGSPGQARPFSTADYEAMNILGWTPAIGSLYALPVTSTNLVTLQNGIEFFTNVPQATQEAALINNPPFSATVFSYAQQLLAANVALSQVAMADFALMMGVTDNTAHLAVISTQFLPAQQQFAVAHHFDPVVFDAEADGLAIAGINNGNNAFATAFGGLSISAFAAAFSTITGTSTAAITQFVNNWIAFFTANPSAHPGISTQLAAYGAAGGDAIGVALEATNAKALSLQNQVANALIDIAENIYLPGVPIGSLQLHTPLQGEIPHTFPAMPTTVSDMVGFVGITQADLHAHASDGLFA